MRFVIFGLLAVMVGLAEASTVSVAGYSVEITEGGVHAVDTMTSQIYETPGLPADIIAKAQRCSARNMSNDTVATSGGSGTFLTGIAGAGRNVNGSVAGGELIELVDPANGLLVANSRVDYTNALIGFSAKSRVSIEAKEGRFRIVQTDIRYLQKGTGSMPNDGYGKLIKTWGTGWEKAVTALAAAGDKVAACMATDKPAEW